MSIQLSIPVKNTGKTAIATAIMKNSQADTEVKQIY